MTVLLATALVSVASFARAAETLDRILVVVNDEIVTEQDLHAAVDPMLAQFRATLSGPELDEKSAEINKKMLDQLIDDRLIRSVAKHDNIKVNEVEIDEMMDDVAKKFPSKEVFERVMREQGMSFTKLRDRFRDQILGRRVVDMKVRSEVSISPGEIRAYYDAHTEEFRSPDKVKLRQILIRAGENRSQEEAQQLAASIVQQIDAGGNMEELAKKYSEASEAPEGGDMGWVEKGQLIEHIDAEIFKLEVGKHTDPIKSQLGYHIFRVEDKQQSETRDFEQVRARIESIVFHTKLADKLKKYMDDLHRNAYIAYKN